MKQKKKEKETRKGKKKGRDERKTQKAETIEGKKEGKKKYLVGDKLLESLTLQAILGQLGSHLLLCLSLHKGLHNKSLIIQL